MSERKDKKEKDPTKLSSLVTKDPVSSPRNENVNSPKAVKTIIATTPTATKTASSNSSLRERKNWVIHLLYVHQEFKECLKIIDEQLKECNGLSEYPLFIKALIKRHQGDIHESLQLFQAAAYLNPTNMNALKQVGRSLFLLGKHKQAISVLEDVETISEEDWEIWHMKGLCYTFMKDYDKAVPCFRRANTISRHDDTYVQLAKLYALKQDTKGAVDVLLEALEFSPENPEVLIALGLLYLKMGENYRAFDYFSSALTQDPKNVKAILATGSIIQDHNEADVALMKYRIAATSNPNSAQLWNNIGMCFFGKQKFVAAIASLKKALYLAPFEWIISFNLGLVHLHTGQYASAFHFFSSSINLKPDFASTYMYLAITLNRLDDFDNACSAYDKALELENSHIFELNYAITLYNRGELDKARQRMQNFEKLIKDIDEDSKHAESEIMEHFFQLKHILGST